MQGPHPFGRLPMQGLSMGANIAPMMYMEVRPQDEQPATINPLAVTPPEFDDFLPCHSRHLPHPPRSSALRPETVANVQQRADAAANAGTGPADATAPANVPAGVNATPANLPGWMQAADVSSVR